MIEAVIVNPVDTLVDTHRAVRQAVSAALAELAEVHPEHDVADLTVDSLLELRVQVGSELKGRVLDLAAVRMATWERALERIEIANPELAATLNATFEERHRSQLELLPGVEAALTQLAGRYRLALASTEPLIGYPKELEPFFEVEAVAQVVGRSPVDAGEDVAVIEAALAELNIESARACYVAAAARARPGAEPSLTLEGLRIVLVGSGGAADSLSDAVVRTVAELVDVLDSW